MYGYDPKFLDGITLPLPRFSPTLAGHVLDGSSELDGGHLASYIHYSVVTSRQRRAPLFAALNIDQSALRVVERTDNWKIDSRVGDDFQLNNDYYRNNPWDRGHIARRANAAWGVDKREAGKASDETFYYSNSALQHENFNRDEWLALEDWVKALDIDKDGRITSFSGPIWGEFARSVTPAGRPTALVPSAFFKIVCFINKDTDVLDVRAFICTQDSQAMADRSGRRLFDHRAYQCTVAEIESRTGLDFDDCIYEKNPCFFHPNSSSSQGLGIPAFPERIEVNGPEDIVDGNTRRPPLPHHDEVYVAAALVNPKRDERTNEWVSIINLSNEKVPLSGWTLQDKEDRKISLSGSLQPGAAKVIKPVSPMQLSNKGGVIALIDNKGLTVDRRFYSDSEGRVSGKPVNFAFPENI